jgi:hypothetical protein
MPPRTRGRALHQHRYLAQVEHRRRVGFEARRLSALAAKRKEPMDKPWWTPVDNDPSKTLAGSKFPQVSSLPPHTGVLSLGAAA